MPFQPWVGIDATLTVPVNLQGTGSGAVFGAGTVGDTANRVELRANGVIAVGQGVSTPTTTLQRIAGPAWGSNAPLDVTAAGSGIQVAEGSNAKQGTAVLAAGTVVVANTSVTANSRIFLGLVALGTVTVPSALGVTARTAGTSFTILASQATDTSTVCYEIFEPG